MMTRRTNIRAFRAFSCLFALIALFPISVIADESVSTVKLDGKLVFIPEVKLAKKVNPVTSFLYIGSWAGGGDAMTSLFRMDQANNQIHIKNSGKLLENSKTRVLTKNNADAFLDGISWGRRQATQTAFKVTLKKHQSVTLEIHADSDVAVFHNGNAVGRINTNNILTAGGVGCFTVALNPGENILSVKQYSSSGAPWMQMSVITDHSRDLLAAWQRQGGLLKKLLYMPRDGAGTPKLEWYSHKGDFPVSFAVRDISTDSIIFRKESAQLGRRLGEETPDLAPGVYEAIYRTRDESASEFFVVGNPADIFEAMLDKVVRHDTTPQAKLNIEAQARRARIMLLKDNYDSYAKKWQGKLAYTLSSLAGMERSLEAGVENFAKDQPGLHIRGFASSTDNSPQYYRVFVPSSYQPDAPLPLLVMVSAGIAAKARPFIGGPAMANLQEARRWAAYAEKHGFGVLWPGYKSAPEGNTYDSKHIDEAIQAVEKDYNIDKRRISVYGSCGAGYHAGRLVSEYPYRFAAIVYDRAVFDQKLSNVEIPSLAKWYDNINPSRYVLDDRNLKIFVMHDNNAAPGHGPMELSTQFLERAKASRGDVVQHLGRRPVGTTRMDMVFYWVAPCRNEHPDDLRSGIAAKAGYAGPISEAFTTPILVVEGTHSFGNDRRSMQSTAQSLKSNYSKYFHGAECALKKDDEVTQDDINNNTLVLIGNPASNSVWQKLQPNLAIKMTPDSVMYKNGALTGNNAFAAIVPHPYAAGKYVLMIGSVDLQYLRRVRTNSLFDAWYDCVVLSAPRQIIAKLDDINQ